MPSSKQCSVKLKLCKTSQILQESICDWVSFKKNSKPSYLQLYFKGHHHRCFSVNIFMWKYFFIASFHASMHSQMFYKIDVLQNSTKFQTLLTPAHKFAWEFFEIFRNIFFTEHLQTTTSDFNSIFLLF